MTVRAEGSPSWHSIDVDLVESRALASLDFHDPGSPSSLIEANHQAKKAALSDTIIKRDPLRSYAETSGAIEADMGVSTLTPDFVERNIKSHQAFEKQVMSQLEADSKLDSRLESLLRVDADEDADEWAEKIGDHIEDMHENEESASEDSAEFSLLESDASVDGARRRRRGKAARKPSKIMKKVKGFAKKVKSKVKAGIKKGVSALKNALMKRLSKFKSKSKKVASRASKAKTVASRAASRAVSRASSSASKQPKGYAPGSPAFEKHTRELYKVNRIPGQPSEKPMDLPLPQFPTLKRPQFTSVDATSRKELKDLQNELARNKRAMFPDVGVVYGKAPTSVYIKQLEADAAKAEGTIGGKYINKIVDNVKLLSGATQMMANISDHNVITMIKERKQGLENTEVNLIETQAAPTARDVVDCVACRFAWLGVEKDIGNSFDVVSVYDAFVAQCANMQQTNIFFTPCTLMFRQIDSMIGNYLASMSVNQLCTVAQMCR